jgi:hypothetical protein
VCGSETSAAHALARSVEGTLRQYFPVSHVCTQAGSGRVNCCWPLPLWPVDRVDCYWVLPAQSFLVPGPAELMTNESARSAAEARGNKSLDRNGRL